MMCLPIGSSRMKTPRIDDFDPHVKELTLKSSLEGMPAIEKPNERKEKTELHANQQTNKDASMQTSKQVNQLTDLPVNQQTSKDANMLSTKQKRKYSTYLTEESVVAIQMHAVQTKRKDHEIVQEAIDRYFEKSKR